VHLEASLTRACLTAPRQGHAGRESSWVAAHAGTPEGVIAAAALKCMGGSLQGKLFPRNDAERDAALAQGYDVEMARSCCIY
jgi:fructose-1,6-bisphosphatase/sedoheptulose 1,7-bisphosphatase-like protein